MLLVMKQPDLGTSLTYMPILLSGVFLAGLRWKYIAVIALGLALALPIGYHMLHDYQRARLTSFPRSRPGPARQRISGNSVDDRGRPWRDVGTRCDPGHTDATSVSAGSRTPTSSSPLSRRNMGLSELL